MDLMRKESYLLWTPVQDAGLTAQVGTLSDGPNGHPIRAVFFFPAGNLSELRKTESVP